MAPSLSPLFPVRAALDVRHPTHIDLVYDHKDFIHVRADAETAAAAPSGGANGAVIGLSILLAVVAIGAAVAAYFIITQRKQLRSLATIRVLYNVGNVANDPEARKSTLPVTIDQEKGTTAEALTAQPEGKLYTIDLDTATAIKVPLSAAATEKPHIMGMPSLRRKNTNSRSMARQRLRIVIPAGVAVADVELVTTSVPTATARTSAVSATRTTASRRNTARTPRSALLSAATAITNVSTAIIDVVHRREKVNTVEAVYQSNGWAPASLVYLPKNPRDTAAAAARPSPGLSSNNGRRVSRKPVRRVPMTPQPEPTLPATAEADESKFTTISLDDAPAAKAVYVR